MPYTIFCRIMSDILTHAPHLTFGQVNEIADILSPIPADIRAMTDNELLAALNA